MIKYIFSIAVLCVLFCSCGKEEEGFTGDWSGTRSVIGPNGEDASLSVIARIGVLENGERNIALNDGENTHDFDVVETTNTLTFTNFSINNQSTEEQEIFIDGAAVLVQDTILRFTYDVNTFQGSAFLSSESFSFDTTKEE